MKKSWIMWKFIRCQLIVLLRSQIEFYPYAKGSIYPWSIESFPNKISFSNLIDNFIPKEEFLQTIWGYFWTEPLFCTQIWDLKFHIHQSCHFWSWTIFFTHLNLSSSREYLCLRIYRISSGLHRWVGFDRKVDRDHDVGFWRIYLHIGSCFCSVR